MKKWPFLINNGRTNVVWQNAYLDQENEFVMDRFPYPFIQMNPQDMVELKVAAGDLVFEPISNRAGVWAEPGMAEKAAKAAV